jgi:hypothetical protein
LIWDFLNVGNNASGVGIQNGELGGFGQPPLAALAAASIPQV